MASMPSKADSAREFTHNNAHSFMHVNHFTFHPIKAVLLYSVIADQSNRLLLKLLQNRKRLARETIKI